MGDLLHYECLIGHGADDKKMLEHPMYIANKKYYENLLNKIILLDPEHFNKSFRIQDTKTKVFWVYQLYIKIYHTENPVGTNFILPPEILNSKFIFCFEYRHKRIW